MDIAASTPEVAGIERAVRVGHAAEIAVRRAARVEVQRKRDHAARCVLRTGLVALLPLVVGQGAAVAQAPDWIVVDPGPHPAGTAHHPLIVRILGYDRHGNPLITSPTPTGYVPTQIRHAYGFDQLSSTGFRQTIAIVDAYDDPTAASDLETAISTFGLAGMHGLSSSDPCTVATGPFPCFQKVYAQSIPTTDSGWALEISLDVQWAHAVAPGANILLVEAATNGAANLYGATSVAVHDGAHVVSMSWGGSESSGELSDDGYFDQPGVAFTAFTASSGDSGTGVIYPAASPYVLGVGGTTLPLDANGNLDGRGNGMEWLRRRYQRLRARARLSAQFNYGIAITGGARGVPDVSYDADPNTGVAVYDSTRYQGQSGWFELGGTSAGAPQWAALVALADQGRGAALTTSNLTNSPAYAAATGSVYGAGYRDVTSGTNGSCGTDCTAAPGYDLVTGLGSPLAGELVPSLAGNGTSPPSGPSPSVPVTD